jgi:hypothetical protein
VAGTVVDADGEPIVGALVDPEPRLVDQPSLATSEDGTFELGAYDLQPGPVTITVTADGFQPFAGVVTLAKDQLVQVRIVLQRS